MKNESKQVTKGRQILALLLLACFILNSSAFAQVGLKLQLVPEVTAIVPGESFYVGLFIQHEKGWHTYYKQPGIVGVPTSIVWTLPPGFKAGELEYPEPEATKMFQINAQGYERDILLQAKIEAPDSLKDGERITLKGKATWMCCGKSCHPGSLELNLELPVSKTRAFDAKWQPIFTKERAAYPHVSPDWEATATEKDLTVTLKLTPKNTSARHFSHEEQKTGIIFFTEDGWINSDQSQLLKLQSDGSLTLTLTRAEIFMGKVIPDQLFGIVQRKGGWHQDGSLRSLKISPDLIR
ncbi:MAG: protein-disulfide reductase DsbD family protein [Verrucomicrobia bacterium]|nr:protein-disulfide reductase DsbD family protein [Verrucomicrobiota bacterium]